MAREMKDSGIEWIGKIPEEWSITRIKYVSVFEPCCDSSKLEENSIVTYTPMECVKNGYVVPRTATFGSLSSSLTPFQNGDIVMAKVTPCFENGNIAILNDLASGYGLGSSELFVFRPTKVQTRFLFYWLQNKEFVQRACSTMTGTGGLKRVSSYFIKNCEMHIPPDEEQRRIVNFLDCECAEIGAVLEKTRASIEEYKQLKQAVITQSVTKGIRGDRLMKDSGIEWIGEIPAEWNAQRIKTIFSLRDERNYLPLVDVNLISLYTDKGVVQHADLETTTGNKASNADGYKIVYENDIIVNIILCWMGAIGRSAFNGVTSPAYDVYIPSDKIDCRFYHHYFRTTGFSGDCYKRGKGIMAMRWRTYSDQFCDIRVVVPPLYEQVEILKATPYNGIKNPRYLPKVGKWRRTLSNLSARANRSKLPGKACQPESDLPTQTSYSVLRSVFADLGIAFFGTVAVPLRPQKRALLLPGRTTSRVLDV